VTIAPPRPADQLPLPIDAERPPQKTDRTPARSGRSGSRPASTPRGGSQWGSNQPPHSSGVVLYAVAFVAYAAIGMVLTLHYNLVDADGPSRVANAGYVLFSRDPHLAAIGFVWNPLPSLAEIPILLFTNLWPALLNRGQAGTFMAAAFMAGAVWQVRGIALDRGLPALWRWIIIIGFACNPMIILYGGNAMSEAPFTFFTLWAVRRLLRWMHDDKVNNLVAAGLALGFDYLTRYEAAAVAAAAAALVVGVTALRSVAPDWGERVKRGMLDGTVLAFPFAICFVGWAVASWVTTGQVFAQFSSQYGNASQVSNASVGVKSFQKLAGGPFEIVLRDILHLEPFLPVVGLIVLLLAVRRIELDCLVPIALFGGVLAFESFAQITGQTFAWFRFFLMSVPLMMVLLTLFWPYRGVSSPGASPPALDQRAPSQGAPAPTSHPLIARIKRPLRSFTLTSRKGVMVGGLGIALLLAPSLPVTWFAMLNPLIGTQSEQYGLRTVAYPSKYPVPQSTFSNDWYVANYLDQLNLPNGSVLMDTFIGWDVWLATQHRKQFVITSDFDFATVLNTPAASGIQYILVSDPAQDGKADAINQRYPTLYATGAGIASLVMTVPQTGDDVTWRLYRVNPPS
jgi:hypothetical protein